MFIKNEKGQAVFELLVFLPFMIFMYMVILSVSSAINGSINQQKITRGYFYGTAVKWNSTIPTPRVLHKIEGVEQFGNYINGWKMRFVTGGTSPLAPCYKLAPFLPASEKEVCEDNLGKDNTQFIRVKTVYGVCGTTYMIVNGGAGRLFHRSDNVASASSCLAL